MILPAGWIGHRLLMLAVPSKIIWLLLVPETDRAGDAWEDSNCMVMVAQ